RPPGARPARGIRMGPRRSPARRPRPAAASDRPRGHGTGAGSRARRRPAILPLMLPTTIAAWVLSVATLVAIGAILIALIQILALRLEDRARPPPLAPVIAGG